MKCPLPLACAALAAALHVAPSVAAPLRIEISFADAQRAAAQPVRLTLRLAAIGMQNSSRTVEKQVQAPGVALIDIPEGIAWQVTAEGMGTWSPAVPLSADPRQRSAPVKVILFPGGTLRGRLIPDQRAARASDLASVSELELRLGAAPGSRAAGVPAKAVVRCPVLKGSGFRCNVPAGRLDLRLKAAGFSPSYLWGIEVAAGAARDLEPLVLRRGTTVVGHVLSDDPGHFANCTVHLAPQRAGGIPSPGSPADVTADRRLRDVARDAKVNDRGFFLFEEVAAGVYSATATQPGFSPARAAAIEVRADLETEIRDPLVLARPASFEVFVEPPLDPYGQSWKLLLFPRDEPFAERSQVTYRGVTSGGHWAQQGISPGHYMLSVLGEGEAHWASQEVTIGVGQSPLFLSVPVVEVRGTVDRGGEPLSATLWFGGVHGARRIRFDSDEKGRFEGFLPQEGSWPVDLAIQEDGGARIGLEAVEVKRPAGKRYAALDIHVPDTLLRGEVVDERGNPLPDALVTSDLQRGKRSSVTADAEGKFGLRSIAPGSIAVRADLGPRTSGWVNAVVEEHGESARLRLVAREEAEYHGRVVSPQGPVAGARVIAFPNLDEVAISTLVDAVTDPEGTFSLRLPANALSLNLVVLPAGFALRMLNVPADPKRPLEIAVDSTGGNLVLPRGGGLLAHGGAFLPTEVISLWVTMNAPADAAEALRIQNVEAGGYVFCWAQSGAASDALRKGGTPPADFCAAGTLRPLTDLSLVPAAKLPAR